MKVRWHGHPMDPSFAAIIQQAVDGAFSSSYPSGRALTFSALLADMKVQKRGNIKGKSKEELMAMSVKDLKQVSAGVHLLMAKTFHYA
jgi:hypothetical protein